MLEKLAIKEDTIVVLKNFDELRSDMSVASGYNADEIEIFIGGSTVPLIQEFSQVTTHDVTSALLAFTPFIAFYHHCLTTQLAFNFPMLTMIQSQLSLCTMPTLSCTMLT